MKIDKLNNIEQTNKYALILISAYIIFEYGRPSWFQPFHLQTITLGLIIIALIFPMKINIKERTVIYATCFIIYCALHVPFARNNYWAYMATVMSIENIVGLLGFAFLMRNYREYKKMLIVWMLSMSILAMIGIIYHGGVPASSYMGDENDFALAMNIVLPFGYFAMIQQESKIKKIILFVVTMIYILANISSFSRGGFVGLLPVVIYCWYRTENKIKYTIVLGIIIAGVMILFAPKGYWDEIKTIIEEKQEESTSELRLYYWECGWRMFKDNLLFGVGPGNFPWNIAYYENEEGKYGRFHGSRPAHSIYFTLLPELGLIGTIIFCLLIAEVLKNRRWMLKRIRENMSRNNKKKQNNDLKEFKYVLYAIDASMIAYFFTGIFLSVLYYPWLWTLIGMSLGLKIIMTDWIKNNQMILVT